MLTINSTLKPKMESTATWKTGAFFYFFCSNKEPWGMNGFVLFIFQWRWWASFHVRWWFCLFVRAGVFSSKKTRRKS